jgi:phospholipid/cholesterol/gamma-HCH transport system substrate-binding protein
MKYKREEIKAGLVILAAILILSAMAILLGGSKFWAKREIYQIRFSAIGGLEKGAAVRLGGFRVGEVLDIAIAPDDASKIEVSIGVTPGTPMHEGAVASVRTLGLVGDYYVLLMQNPGPPKPLPPGSVIPSRDTMELGDLLAQVAELSQTLNGSVEEVVTAVNQVLSEENITHIQTTLQGLSRLTTQGEESVATITADLSRALRRLNTTVAHLDSFVLENRGNVGETILGIKDAVNRLDSLLLVMHQTIVENQADLRSIVVNFKEDSEKTGQLIDNLDGRVTVTGDYLEDTMANLLDISENLKLLSNQLKRHPWRLIYRERVKR